MSTESREPSEEELRAAYEAELKRLRVEHVLLDNVAALANLGMRRTGLAPGTESERDPEQVRLAIESLRALLPVLEQAAPSQIAAIRDAVSQLQMAYVRIGGTGAGARCSRRASRVRARRSRHASAAHAAVSAALAGVSAALAGVSAARGGASGQARRARTGPAQRPSLGARPVAKKAVNRQAVGDRLGTFRALAR